MPHLMDLTEDLMVLMAQDPMLQADQVPMVQETVHMAQEIAPMAQDLMAQADQAPMAQETVHMAQEIDHMVTMTTATAVLLQAD